MLSQYRQVVFGSLRAQVRFMQEDQLYISTTKSQMQNARFSVEALHAAGDADFDLGPH